jgi:hypothetical protein
MDDTQTISDRQPTSENLPPDPHTTRRNDWPEVPADFVDGDCDGLN